MTEEKKEASSRRVRVNGVELSYYDQGAGAVPVIFIHGFPFNKQSWLPQLQKIEGHRLLALDLRGFGESTASKDTPSIDLFASDLSGFMDALDIKKAVLCGLSMGGYITMNAAGRFPEKIAGLVLCDTQCIADSEEGKTKRYNTIKKIEQEGLSNFAEEFTKGVLCEKTQKENKPLVEEIKSVVKANNVEAVTSALHALAQRRETCTLLKRIDIPTLIICGKEDALTPLSQSELLMNTISNSQMKTIKDAGHLSNLEQSEEFNKYLQEFLGSIKG